MGVWFKCESWLVALRNQGDIFQVSLNLPERSLNERHGPVTQSPGPLCFLPTPETWTSSPLQKGAQVLTAIGRSLDFSSASVRVFPRKYKVRSEVRVPELSYGQACWCAETWVMGAVNILCPEALRSGVILILLSGSRGDPVGGKGQ